MVTSEIERELRRRAEAPVALGDILESAQNAQDVPGAKWAPRVARVWHAVNGVTERAHTVGIFVERPRRAGAQPVLVVYVDSKSCEVDFMANREVYLARLAQAGLSFAEVRFRQSKRPPTVARRTVEEKTPQEELPDLTPDEEREAAALLEKVPAALKSSVSRALRVSLQAEKLESS